MNTSPIRFFSKASPDPTTLSGIVVPSELMIYLKTTETCQLNCDHCFTNGSRGQKIYFNPTATIDWFHRMRDTLPDIKGGSIAFHGGEPMLAPIQDMRRVWSECKDLWPSVWWSTTTNLVYTLDDEKREFFKDAFTHGIATSWDKDIRFSDPRQEQLWHKNVKTLLRDGHEMTLMISLSKSIIDMPVEELLAWVIDLGVPYLHLERITSNGNATINGSIIPTNQELDKWFVKLWDATVKLGAHKHFSNLFINGILSSFVHSSHSGCRCRACEQKIFTINANGTIGGCPNSAVTNIFGTIEDDIYSLLTSEQRVGNIACETYRNPICYSCDVYDICNGDCHQLNWQGDVCASPKTLMSSLKTNNDRTLYLDVLHGYQGAE